MEARGERERVDQKPDFLKGVIKVFKELFDIKNYKLLQL